VFGFRMFEVKKSTWRQDTTLPASAISAGMS
jgi:hypothetical protein